MKIRPVGDGLFHSDRQTDMTRPTVAIRNPANTPKNNKVLSDLTLRTASRTGWLPTTCVQRRLQEPHLYKGTTVQPFANTSYWRTKTLALA